MANTVLSTAIETSPDAILIVDAASSLDLLRRAQVDRIKIAREFVGEIGHAMGGGPVVRATIALARELGVDVIAEGVETAEQLRQLDAWGCVEAQGFYFAGPLPRRAARVLRSAVRTTDFLQVFERGSSHVRPFQVAHHQAQERRG
jgi:predicted signal transduction protein with EAL and GGDEF domain